MLSSHCSFNRQTQLCFANFDRESVSNRITERHLVSFLSVPSWTVPWEDAGLIEINERTFSAAEGTEEQQTFHACRITLSSLC